MKLLRFRTCTWYRTGWSRKYILSTSLHLLNHKPFKRFSIIATVQGNGLFALKTTIYPHIILLHILRLKLLWVLGPTRYLSIMHSLNQFPKGFVQKYLKTRNSLVLADSTYPFQFHPYDMTNLAFYINGVQRPCEPLTMDFNSPFGAATPYEALFSSTGIHHDERAPMNTFEMFTIVSTYSDLT